MPFDRSPISTRRGIPFFVDKSPAAFQLDPYERYDEMVVRQTALHLTDGLWPKYPFQPVLDWLARQLPDLPPRSWADVGCGVGRLLGTLARRWPKSEAIGIDYSYQLLRRARAYWVEGKVIEVPLQQQGWPSQVITGHNLTNVRLALAQAEDLPLAEASVDLLLSTFTLDRLTDPAQALTEMRRILRLGGHLLLASPLNFREAVHWQHFYPASRLVDHLRKNGWRVAEPVATFVCQEPLDAHGNTLHWHCVGIVAEPA